MSLNEDQIELYRDIDKVLWNEWDPMGINEFDEARDEYYEYLTEVFRLKSENVDEETLSKYLYDIETVKMELPGDFENCKRVAQLIIELEL